MRCAYLIHILATKKKKKNSRAPPAYVSHQISEGTVTQRVGKCHCSARRPEQCLSYTIQISVCLASSDRTNSSLPGTLARPSAQTTAGAATFLRDECSRASLCLWLAAPHPQPPAHRPSCLFILLSVFCLPNSKSLTLLPSPFPFFFDILWCPSLGYEFLFYAERLKVPLLES